MKSTSVEHDEVNEPIVKAVKQTRVCATLRREMGEGKEERGEKERERESKRKRTMVTVNERKREDLIAGHAEFTHIRSEVVRI